MAGLLAALAGCAAAVSEPRSATERVGLSGIPEWQPHKSEQVRYETSPALDGTYTSVLFSRRMPYPLGNTFVSDLAIVLKNPQAGRYTLPDPNVVVTLARSTEIANRRTALIHCTGGTLDLSHDDEGRLTGTGKVEFTDELENGARYLVIFRFAP